MARKSIDTINMMLMEIKSTGNEEMLKLMIRVTLIPVWSVIWALSQLMIEKVINSINQNMTKMAKESIDITITIMMEIKSTGNVLRLKRMKLPNLMLQWSVTSVMSVLFLAKMVKEEVDINLDMMLMATRSNVTRVQLQF